MSTWRYRLPSAAVALGALLGLGLAPALATPAQATTCTTYYISSSSGSDSNDGCSTAAPWQTLTNVNATTFAAGSQILFQDGGSWTGTLHPLGSGTSGSPIVVSSYGSGSAPIIAGGGAAEAVYLDNQSYVTIENLEITNTTTSAAVRSGIEVQNDTSGILYGISILNNNIHDILGYWSTAENVQPTNSSGIAFNLSDSYSTNGWNGVLIQGNTLTKTDAGGIYLGSLNGTGHSILTSNVTITNNTLTDSGGNDIVCVYCSAPVVEYNVATNSGYRYSGAGFWTALSNNGIWQYNEISRQWRNLWDGEAFDIDHDNDGTVIQYNYTHDNPFGFMEWCCSSSFGATNSTVRYNISQNDGAENAVIATLEGIKTSGTNGIYNNTIYMGAGDNGDVTNTTAAGTNITFSNNIIYKLGTGGYSTSGTWTHNLMYGNHPSTEPTDASKITTDPLFVAPGGAGTGRATASAYELLSGSPALGAGTLISSNGGVDYFGNAVSSTAAPNIGAYNGSAVSTPTATYGAYWPFEEGTGTTSADATNDHNTATLHAGASWTTGEVGSYAVSLTGGTTSYVDVPTTAIDTGASYSVAAWVKLSSLTGNQTFASIDGTNISPFYLQLTGGKLAFTVRSADSTSSTATTVSGTTAATGTWYHLVGVYDNTAHTIALYVNGVLQGTAAFSSPWKATGHTAIGRAKWNGGNVDFVNGAIDDVRMYSKALAKQEAVALATNANGYFELNEGTGTAAANFMGNVLPTGGLQRDAAWTTGKVGSYAVSEDGTFGTKVTIPAAEVNTGGSYTVAAWVKLSSLTGTQTFVSIDAGTISPFYLQLTGGDFAMTVRSANSTSSTATTVTGLAPSTGTWYHVIGMYNASTSTLSLYVNGTLQNTATFSSPWTAVGSTELGGALWGGAQVDWTNGSIDDVHFYNRILTSTEIAELAAG